MISAIWAMDKNWLIGIDNDLPWHYPEDLKYFKEVTRGSSVVMGRKTFESIHKVLGKPLPGRQNIVLSRSDFEYEGVISYKSVNEFVKNNKEDVFIIGGSNIYEQTLHYCDKLYITFINDEHEGNVYFPKFDLSAFKLITKTQQGKLNFCVYERI